MPWQRLVADVACEIDPATGLFVYREVGLTVPRQSGKTTLILGKCTHRCLAWQRQNVKYAAQTRNDSRVKWEDDYLEALEHSPFREKFRARKTNGNEAIIWHGTRSKFGITSTTEKAGHGGTLDEGYIDEAFAQVDARLEQAFKPAMVTKPNAQLWVVSTAGTEKSLYLKAKVDKGRAIVESGVTEGVAYFEWSAPDEREDYDNPELWREVMPALHWPDCPEGCRDHTVNEKTIRDDFLSMELNEFRRAYLNQWCPEVTHEPIIDPDVWRSLGDRKNIVGDLMFGIAVDPDRTMASIGAAGERKDARVGVEVIEHRPGTAWVIDRAVELQEKHTPRAFYIDKSSAAGSLVDGLIEAGVRVEVVGTAENAVACGQWYDDATQDKLRHRNDDRLTTAMMGAMKRYTSDRWVFDRRGSGLDLTPLDACTLARYGACLYLADMSVENNIW